MTSQILLILKKRKCIEKELLKQLGLVFIGQEPNESNLTSLLITQKIQSKIILLDKSIGTRKLQKLSRNLRTNYPVIKLYRFNTSTGLDIKDNLNPTYYMAYTFQLNTLDKSHAYFHWDIDEKSKVPSNKRFTAREIEIINQISFGLTNKEIAKALDIKTRTVESHKRNIYKNTGTKNILSLLRLSTLVNLLSQDSEASTITN